MAASFPTSVVTTALLGGVANGVATALSGAINNSVTTIPVVDTTNFPAAGYATIGTEVFYYGAKTANSFTSVTRGSDGSAAASHSSGDAVNMYVVAANITNLQNEVIAIETDINARFGIGAASTAISIPSGVSFAIASQLKSSKIGVVGAPAYSFVVDATTGMTTFGGGARLDFIVSGTDVITLTTSVMNSSAAFQGPNGLVSNPTFQFTNAATTGFYLGGADICVAVSGTQRAQWEGNQYQQADGTVSLPAYSWFNDVDTGIYRTASNRLSFSLGGVKTAEFFSSGSADDTAYAPMQLYSGGGSTNTCLEVYTYSTTGVSTGGGKNIASGLDLNTYLFLIAGADGSGNDFNDVVNSGYYTAGGSPSVISSYTTRGSPAARTYAHNGDGSMKLTMASGTYTVRVVGFGGTVR